MINRWLPHGGGSHKPRGIIVHAMAEYIEYNDGVLHAADFLEKVGLSAHILVEPDGTLIRCRRDNEIAWHAKGHNYQTVGIEVLLPGQHNYASFRSGIDSPDWVAPIQYDATIRQCRQWVDDWPIEWIEQHSVIDPARKYDPGKGFPWSKFISEVGL